MFTFLTQSVFIFPACHLTYYKKVKVSLCSIKHQAIKIYGGLEEQLQKFLTSTLQGKNNQLHIRASVPKGKSTQYHLDRRLGRPCSQSGPSGEKNPSPCLELSPSSSPALSQSLHWPTNLTENECTFPLVNIQKNCIYWIERENS